MFWRSEFHQGFGFGLVAAVGIEALAASRILADSISLILSSCSARSGLFPVIRLRDWLEEGLGMASMYTWIESLVNMSKSSFLKSSQLAFFVLNQGIGASSWGGDT
jgi:hypothetical protein